MEIFIIIGISALGMFVKNKLRARFKQYSQIPVRSGYSGAEVAQTMLRDYGINDVQIQQGKGMLSDHYNPMTKVIKLSPEVYHGRSVAAAAVAAHECGHAVQHATSYSMLQLRSALVPIVKIASFATQLPKSDAARNGMLQTARILMMWFIVCQWVYVALCEEQSLSMNGRCCNRLHISRRRVRRRLRCLFAGGPLHFPLA